jgi:hypothetical protein
MSWNAASLALVNPRWQIKPLGLKKKSLLLNWWGWNLWIWYLIYFLSGFVNSNLINLEFILLPLFGPGWLGANSWYLKTNINLIVSNSQGM